MCIQSKDVLLLLNPCSGMQLIVEGVNPDTRARTLRAYKVCNSYLYILDQVLLPTRRNDLTAIPDVNATFLQALASLGTSSSSSSSSSSTATDNVSLPKLQAFAQLLPALGKNEPKELASYIFPVITKTLVALSHEALHKQGNGPASCSCLTSVAVGMSLKCPPDRAAPQSFHNACSRHLLLLPPSHAFQSGKLSL